MYLNISHTDLLSEQCSHLLSFKTIHPLYIPAYSYSGSRGSVRAHPSSHPVNDRGPSWTGADQNHFLRINTSKMKKKQKKKKVVSKEFFKGPKIYFKWCTFFRLQCLFLNFKFVENVQEFECCFFSFFSVFHKTQWHIMGSKKEKKKEKKVLFCSKRLF